MATKKETTTKKPTTRKAVKTAEKKITTKPGSLAVPVLSLVGSNAGTLNLPKEIFGTAVNKALLTQAIRVYSTNQKTHWANTRTRGEVEGSTRKIYRQKGTGGARHGSKRAPIFVHGGIAFGPKYRKTVLDLPKKMKKAALISALSQKILDGEIVVVEGLEKATGKTKQMANFLTKLEKRSALIVDRGSSEKAVRAIRNLKTVEYLSVEQLNAYDVIKHQSLLLTRTAIERLEKGPDRSEKSDEIAVSVGSVNQKTKVAVKSEKTKRQSRKVTQ